VTTIHLELNISKTTWARGARLCIGNAEQAQK